ncbi:MAG: Holliday junction resolvase RuvX [Planctomycetota bacterium]
MRCLALDLGAKRTGVASGDDGTHIATPLTTIDTASETERWRQLDKMISQEQPDALVVGVPFNMDGTTGPAAKAALNFIAQAATRFSIPVHPQDERLTSVAADEAMSQSGLTHGQKKQRRDALAAAAILRAWFASSDGGAKSNNSAE